MGENEKDFEFVTYFSLFQFLSFESFGRSSLRDAKRNLSYHCQEKAQPSISEERKEELDGFISDCYVIPAYCIIHEFVDKDHAKSNCYNETGKGAG